jgi:hypothetical protein
MKRTFWKDGKQLLVVGCMVLLIAALASCKKSNDNMSNPPSAAVMAFNLAPDKAAVGISLSGSNLLQTPLPYGAYSGAYLSIYTGNRIVEAYEQGNPPFASTNFSFDSSRYYSVFVLGNKGNYKNLVVNDNFDSLASTDKAYVRYINAIPDSSKPQINISAGGSPVVTTAAGYSSLSDFVPVAAGDLSVSVNNEGSINSSRTISIEQKKVYTILLTGDPAATDSSAKVQIRYIQNGSL